MSCWLIPASCATMRKRQFEECSTARSGLACVCVNHLNQGSAVATWFYQAGCPQGQRVAQGHPTSFHGGLCRVGKDRTPLPQWLSRVCVCVCFLEGSPVGAGLKGSQTLTHPFWRCPGSDTYPLVSLQKPSCLPVGPRGKIERNP